MFTVRKTIRLCAALGVATATALGLAAAPAQAATPEDLRVQLNIQKLGNGDCRVVISGNIPMDSTRAQYLVDNGANARVEIWGDDPLFDNRLFRIDYAQVYASAPRNGNGLLIFALRDVNCYDKLNEDTLPADETDEIYGKVIVESVGFERKTKRTNTVSGVFGYGVRI